MKIDNILPEDRINTRDIAIKARVAAAELGLELNVISTKGVGEHIPKRSGIPLDYVGDQIIELFILRYDSDLIGFVPTGYCLPEPPAIPSIWFLEFLRADRVSISACKDVVRRALAFEDSRFAPIARAVRPNPVPYSLQIWDLPGNRPAHSNRYDEDMERISKVPDHDIGTLVAMTSMFRYPYELVSPEIISFIGKVFKTWIPRYVPKLSMYDGRSIDILTAWCESSGWPYKPYQEEWKQFMDIVHRLSPEEARYIVVDTVVLPSRFDKRVLVHVSPGSTRGYIPGSTITSFRGFWVSIDETSSGSLAIQEADISESVPDAILFFVESPYIPGYRTLKMQRMTELNEDEWKDSNPEAVQRFMKLLDLISGGRLDRCSACKYLQPMFIALKELSQCLGYLPCASSNLYRLPDGSETFLDWVQRGVINVSTTALANMPGSSGTMSSEYARYVEEGRVLEYISKIIPDDEGTRSEAIAVLPVFGIKSELGAEAMVTFGKKYKMKGIQSAGKSLLQTIRTQIGITS